MATVRAAVMTAPGTIEIREVDRPQAPEDGLLLKVDEVGLCGSDKHMYLGHMRVPFPVVFGHEFTGHIEQLGPEANDSMIVMGGSLREGDPVIIVPGSQACHQCYTCLHSPGRASLCPNREVHGFLRFAGPDDLRGGCAEYAVIRAGSWVYRPADGLAPARRVLAEPTAVATRAVERALAPGLPSAGEGYGIGKTVVVQGVGPVGLLIVAVLRSTGAGRIIATDLVDGRLDMARRLGADVTINAGETTVEERVSQIRELSQGAGADLVIEAAGVPAAFAEALQLVRRGGKVIELGHYTDPGATSIHPYVICYKDLDVLGVWAYPQIQFETALSFLERCELPLEDLISHRLPLEDVEQGLHMLGQEGVLKVVIQP